MSYLITAENFFFEIDVALNRLIESDAKRPADLLFVILGLNHLREWIAPGYKDERKHRKPANGAEEFFEAVYENADWKVVNTISNQTKHVGKVPSLSAEYGLLFDAWPSVDEARSFDDGPPTGFSYDGHNILPVLERVRDLYRENWFAPTPNK